MATPRARADGVLRVRIAARDPRRGAELAEIVAGLGHRIVTVPDDAQIVLADGDAADSDDEFVVTLGLDDRGQAGLLPPDPLPAQIDAALRAVAAGLSVRAAQPHQPGFLRLPGDDAPLLTPREIEVLAAIGDGLSNKEAARRLGISQHTVKFHVESLFRKLDATSRAEAVHKGLRQGLIEL